MNNNISVTLTSTEIAKITKMLAKFETPSKNQYIKHLYTYNGCKISLYTTNALVIQGNECEAVYKSLFPENSNTTQKGPVQNLINGGMQTTSSKENVIGSDEVGVGDFFGGLTVAAAYVPSKEVAWLKAIGVCDSKQLTDVQIMQLYKQFKDRIDFEMLSIIPEQYNAWYDSYNNSHIIKAIMHNECLTKLNARISDSHIIVVDQFANAKNYYSYLTTAHKKACKVDVFVTQAESKYIAVACASIIARVAFLNQIANLEDLYHYNLLLGASNPNIIKIGKTILNKNGKNILDKVCKKHFITYQKVLGVSHE